MAYATLSELRSFAGIPEADTADDAFLQVALDAASAQIDSYAGRSFNVDATTSVRYFTVGASGAVIIDPIQTTTGLVVETDDDNDGVYETVWTIGTDFTLYPYNAEVAGQPWTKLERTGRLLGRSFPTGARRVRVTAKFGWTEVPAPIVQATLLQALRLFMRKQAPFGIAGSPDLGSEMRILAKLDPDVEALVRPYRRRWAVVTSGH